MLLISIKYIQQTLTLYTKHVLVPFFESKVSMLELRKAGYSLFMLAHVLNRIGYGQMKPVLSHFYG